MEYNLSRSNLGVAAYMRHTYGWMFIGLLITFATAVVFYMSNMWMIFYGNLPLVLGAFVVEIFLVSALSFRIRKISKGAAKGIFFAYAMINGITITSIFVIYELSSLILVFIMAAAFFGGLSIYGFATKKDLSGWGPYLFAGLIGLLVFWISSLFINLQAFQMVACVIGLIIFIGFTAYDTQRVKARYYEYGGDEEMLEKGSIFGALQLYLDFINIFMYLLQLFGNRK
ncbi:MAG: Bax inhibitor-1/YccA family protein [Anaerovoracaceae bacterium]